MSIENHPNLHAIKLAMSACVMAFRNPGLNHSAGPSEDEFKDYVQHEYYRSLRGGATAEIAPDITSLVDFLYEQIVKWRDKGERDLVGYGDEIKDLIVNFVYAVETLVDEAVENGHSG